MSLGKESELSKMFTFPLACVGSHGTNRRRFRWVPYPGRLLADLHMELSSFGASAAARPGGAKCRATWPATILRSSADDWPRIHEKGAGDTALAVSMRRAAELQRVRFG